MGKNIFPEILTERILPLSSTSSIVRYIRLLKPKFWSSGRGTSSQVLFAINESYSWSIACFQFLESEPNTSSLNDVGSGRNEQIIAFNAFHHWLGAFLGLVNRQTLEPSISSVLLSFSKYSISVSSCNFGKSKSTFRSGRTLWEACPHCSRWKCIETMSPLLIRKYCLCPYCENCYCPYCSW